MQKSAFFPPANSIRMVPYNKALSDAFNFRAPEDATFEGQLNPGQLPQAFAQKVQYTDQQHLVFYATPGATVTVQILNAAGAVVSTLANPLTTSYLHTYQDATGATYTDELHYRRWLFNSVTYPEGFYRVFVKIEYDESNIDYYYSNPIWVRRKHKDTILLSYTNTSLAYDIRFDVLDCVFNLRLNSHYLKTEPAGSTTVYEDQNNNTRKLYDEPFTVYNLSIGGLRGLPAYIIDLINRAMAMDVFTIENVRYIKTDGAKLDIQSFDTSGLQWATIQLKRYYNASVGQHISKDTTIFTIPALGPFKSFAFTGWVLQDSVSGKIVSDGVRMFDDLATVDGLYLDFLNLTKKPALNLGGEFLRDTDSPVVYYRNGPDENFTLVTAPLVLTTYLRIKINVTDVTQPFGYTYAGKGTHIWIAENYATGVITEPGHNSFGQPIQSNLGSNITYGTTGDKYIRIYTDDKMTVLKFLSQTNKVTEIIDTTNVSANLQRFWASGQGLTGTLSLDFLKRADLELRELNLGFNQIEAIAGDWAGVTANAAYRYLRYITLSNNELTSTAVNNFFIQYRTYVNYISGGGSINTKFQTPAAPPTPTSAGERTAIAAVSTIVITD